jgi:hypothetical protein
VAAVRVICSGDKSDKSDKKESAGRFAMLWGLCVTAAVVDWQSVRLNDDSQHQYVDFPKMTWPTGPARLSQFCSDNAMPA